MSNIKVMDEHLANKIAAGEVVERISSVVKELVENSIDAKAKNIVVDLLDAGTKSIKVNDDGIGMDKDDSENCFLRHATSKIKNEDDLYFINTLGFRGEALPSIAAVAKVDLKTSQGNIGTHIVLEGGKKVLVEQSDARKGTIMEIKDLFYNTPARLKFLKSEQTELANVTSFIERLALSHDDISFTLNNNDKRLVYTSGSGDLLHTIHELYGYNVSSNMIEVKMSNDDADIYGYICKPTILKSNRNHMITIVNGRIVKNNDLNRAINEGYHTFKPDIKYPVVVLKIETDPTLIDVNIHPTKQDIKISKIEELNEMITKNINSSLKKALLIPEINETNYIKEYEATMDINDSFIKESEIPYGKSNSSSNNKVFKQKVEQEELDFKVMEDVLAKVEESSREKEENILIKKIEMYPVGIAFGTYIIAQNEDKMFLIDQHAAQERINYERVLKGMKNKKVVSTPLLIPITIELSASDALIIKENLEFLTELGFTIEEFGLNTFIVKAHPTWLIEGIEEASIRKIFDIVIEGKFKFDRIKFNDHVAATMACKMSVKGNESITLEEAENLLDDLVLCDNPYNCPHGRPTIITFTRYELERMFKRVMN